MYGSKTRVIGAKIIQNLKRDLYFAIVLMAMLVKLQGPALTLLQNDV